MYHLLQDSIKMPKYIKWPKGEFLQETVELFENMWDYPQCAGAIDGSHIPIIALSYWGAKFCSYGVQ